MSLRKIINIPRMLSRIESQSSILETFSNSSRENIKDYKSSPSLKSDRLKTAIKKTQERIGCSQGEVKKRLECRERELKTLKKLVKNQSIQIKGIIGWDSSNQEITSKRGKSQFDSIIYEFKGKIYKGELGSAICHFNALDQVKRKEVVFKRVTDKKGSQVGTKVSDKFFQKKESLADLKFTLRHRYLTVMPGFREILLGIESVVSVVRDCVVCPIQKIAKKKTDSWTLRVWNAYRNRDKNIKLEVEKRFHGDDKQLLEEINNLSSHRKDYLKLQWAMVVASVPGFILGVIPGALCLLASMCFGVVKMQYDASAYVHYWTHKIQHLIKDIKKLEKTGGQGRQEKIDALKHAIEAFRKYQKKHYKIQEMESKRAWYYRLFFWHGRERLSTYKRQSNQYVRVSREHLSVSSPKCVGIKRMVQTVLGAIAPVVNSVVGALSKIGVVASGIASISSVLGVVLVGVQFLKHKVTQDRLEKIVMQAEGCLRKIN